MFGFFKDDCNEMDLFGYIFLACGGLHNQLMIDKKFKYEFTDYDSFTEYQNKLIDRIHHQLGQRGKRVTPEQETRIFFATELIQQHLFQSDIKNNKIKPCVLKSAEMLKKDNFSFHDKSVNVFREELAKFGCVFKF